MSNYFEQVVVSEDDDGDRVEVHVSTYDKLTHTEHSPIIRVRSEDKWEAGVPAYLTVAESKLLIRHVQQAIEFLES